MIRTPNRILGAALLFGVSTARVPGARAWGERGPPHRKANREAQSSSQTSDTPEIDEVAKKRLRNADGIGRKVHGRSTRILDKSLRAQFSIQSGFFRLVNHGRLFVTDRDPQHLSRSKHLTDYKNLSNAGAGVLIAARAKLAVGAPKHNEHWSETGFLRVKQREQSVMLKD